MTDQKDLFDDVAPDASAMIESIRAHGYTLPTAVADLIDNSITARAQNVWIDLHWDGDDSWISLTDDGEGMTEQELVSAMRLGSRSPLEARSAHDLGRFGLGLKTASFSQARRLTVTSLTGTAPAVVRRWDLDYLAQPDVNGWRLLRSAHPDTGARADEINRRDLEHGTQVLLEVLDRVVSDSSDGQDQTLGEDHFLWEIGRVKTHLGMVFHRFIQKPGRGLKIFVNGEPVAPWDPFLVAHPATEPLGEHPRFVGTDEAKVTVQGFVLPHRDRFESPAAHRVAGGAEGWNAQQGFYLYRGDRLIIAGDWLQLRWQKEEHFKLARIRVDIPNSIDHEWRIDVKKSTAAPPAALRGWLKSIAVTTRKRAKEVYAFRGAYGPRGRRKEQAQRPWKRIERPGGEFGYRIDRRHPVLKPLAKRSDMQDRERLETLLRLIEETVPVQRIWIDTAENQDGVAVPFSDSRDVELKEVIAICHRAQQEHAGLNDSEAWDVLRAFEGFQGETAQALIEVLREETGT